MEQHKDPDISALSDMALDEKEISQVSVAIMSKMAFWWDNDVHQMSPQKTTGQLTTR